MNTVRIALMSDLHLEFDRQRREGFRRRRREPSRSALRKRLDGAGHPDLGPSLGPLVDLLDDGTVHCPADVLVLAGDIDLGTKAVDYAGHLSSWLSVPVVLVAGNHEFYGDCYSDALAEMRAASEDYSRVHFLERDVAVLPFGDERVRFLGCTLFTDFDLFGDADHGMNAAGLGMTDYRGAILHDGEAAFTPAHSLEIHRASRHWLTATLAEPFDGPSVVVTHHAPSRRSIPQNLRRDPLAAAYASSLEAIVETAPCDLWCHGHTHASALYDINATRIACNPRGYTPRHLNKRFRSDFVLTLGQEPEPGV